MGLISQTFEGMYNGVSQQPAPLRMSNQFQEQINFSSNIVDGVQKRPNTEFLTLIDSVVDNNSYIHTINRSLTDKYKVMFTGEPSDPIEIFKLDGTKLNVIYQDADAKAYLNETNPRENIKALTLSDETYVLNKQVVVQEDPPSNLLQDKIQMAWVKKGLPEVTYKLKLYRTSGSYIGTVSYTTPAPSNSVVQTSSTEDIANELAAKANQLLNDKGLQGSYDITNDSSVIIFRHENTVNYADNKMKLVTSDSFGDTAFIAINSKVNDFMDLPPTGIEYYPIAVTGNRGIEDGAFYVEYDKNEEVWLETRALFDADGEALTTHLDPYTMPHILVKETDTTFKFKRATWKENTVGDDVSSPSPSFVGEKINDLFFYRDRVGYLSKANIIMTKAGEYTNFFPKTATAVLDTDPIDVTAKTKQETELNHAVAFTRALVVFSEQVQFAVGSAGTVLTPETITVDPSTYFETSPLAEPKASGPNIYFCVPKGDYTGVREYYVNADTLTDDAEEITKHVPYYIPKNVIDVASSTAYNSLFVLSNETPDTIYVYNYQWGGEQKLQNAWSKWKFKDEEILDMSVIDNYLYLIIKQGTRRSLVRLDLRQASSDPLPIKVYLDNLVLAEGVYNDAEEYTYFDLPYSDLNLEDYQIVNRDTGLLINRTEVVDSTTLRALGDYSGREHFIGKPFESRLEFNKFYLKDQNGLPDIQGKIQLKTITLAFTKTGEFKLVVRPYGRDNIRDYVDGNPELEEYLALDTIESTFSGIILGEAVLNTPPVLTGEQTFAVTTNARTAIIELVADTHLPASFQFTAFEAEYNNRANHIR